MVEAIGTKKEETEEQISHPILDDLKSSSFAAAEIDKLAEKFLNFFKEGDLFHTVEEQVRGIMVGDVCITESEVPKDSADVKAAYGRILTQLLGEKSAAFRRFARNAQLKD